MPQRQTIQQTSPKRFVGEVVGSIQRLPQNADRGDGEQTVTAEVL